MRKENGKMIGVVMDEKNAEAIENFASCLPEWHIGRIFMEECVEEYRKRKLDMAQRYGKTPEIETGAVRIGVYCQNEIYDYLETPGVREYFDSMGSDFVEQEATQK